MANTRTPRPSSSHLSSLRLAAVLAGTLLAAWALAPAPLASLTKAMRVVAPKAHVRAARAASATMLSCSATHFTVGISALTAPLGQYVAVTVTALDNTPQVCPTYTGSVSFASTDFTAAATVSSTNPQSQVTPAPYTFSLADAGVHTFYVQFGTPGFQTLTASDSANAITGTSPNVSTSAVLFSSGTNIYDFSTGSPASTAVGQTTTATVQIQLSNNVNFQSAALATGFAAGNGGPGDFSLGSSSCNRPAGSSVETCSIPVTFQPSRPGTRQAPLVITDSNSQQYFLGLSGLGKGGAISFTPGVINEVTTFASTSAAAFGSVDSAGNLYIADRLLGTVQLRTPAGVVTTIAGNGLKNQSAPTLPALATAISINGPRAAKLDAAGNLYIDDQTDNVVLKLDKNTGEVTTVAGAWANGNGSFNANDDGSPATSASLANPTDIAVDASGNIYIADSANSQVRRVDAATGIITLYAGANTGNCTVNCVPNFGQPAAGQLLNDPTGLALDGAGNLYIADSGAHAVYRVDATASHGITLFAGSCTAGACSSGYSGDGGSANSAALNTPQGIAVDTAGDVYIADKASNVVRRVDATANNNSTPGVIHTIAGGGSPVAGIGDGGAATDASLDNPQSVWVDSIGTVYIGDYNNGESPTTKQHNEIRSIAVSLGQLDDFKTVLLGTTSAAQSLLITNVGNDNFSLDSFQTTSTNSPADYAESASTCSNSLAPGGGCSYSVVFAPNHVGEDAGQVSVANSVANATAKLSGIGAQITESPALLAFVSTGLGILSGQQSVVFTNPSTTNQTAFFTSAVITGTNAADFSVVTNGCSGGIAPGGCSIALQYSPTTIATETALLTLTDGASTSPQLVTLTGSILVAPSAIAISAGNNQSAGIGQTFASPLQVLVTGIGSVPAPNIAVTFTAPVTGPSGVFASTGTGSTTVVTNANGVATAAALTANGITGAYLVNAQVTKNGQGIAVSGAQLSFSATNTGLSSNVGTAAPSPMTFTFEFPVANAISAIQVLTAGATGLDFSQHASTLGTDCVVNSTYAAGSLCTVQVDFTPTAPGVRKGAVVLYTGTGQPFSVLQTAYFTATGTGSAVTFLPPSPAAPRVTSLANVGKLPLGLKVDSAGNIFFIDSGTKSVKEVVAGTSNVVSLMAGLTAPRDLALDGAGNIYVTDTNGGFIKRIYRIPVVDGGYGADVLWISPAAVPFDIVSDGAQVYFASATGIQTFSAGSTTVSSAINFTSVGTLQGLALDASGNFYFTVPAKGASGLFKLNRGATTATVVSTPGVTLVSPTGVAVDAAGNLYVSDSGLKAVYEIPVSGASAIDLTSGVAFSAGGPGAVALDAAGNVYVPDSGQASSANIYQVGLSTPPSVSFPSTNEGSSSASQTVTVNNVGNDTLTFNSLAFGTGNFSSTGSNCATGILSGGSCSAVLSFTPAASGLLADNFTLTDNTLNDANNSSASQQIAVSGTGVSTAPVAANLTAFSGSPQSQVVGQAFASVLVAQVTDVNNVGVPGISVVFTAPASGATGTFTGNVTTVTEVTDSHGFATTPAFTANTVAGGPYSVSAAVASPALAASFSLTNAPGALAQITVVVPALVNAGQSTNAATATFDQFGNPVTVGNLTFTSSDTAALLPAPSPAGTVAATFNTQGPQTLTATSGTISGSASTTVLVHNFNFGPTPVNTNTPVSQKIYLGFQVGTNASSYSVVTEGMTGLDFTDLGDGTCTTGPQAANSACTLDVQFKPTAVGQRLGAIVVRDNNHNLLQTIYLSGVGTAPQGVFTAGTVKPAFSVGDGGENSIAFDAAGDLYYSDQSQGNIVKQPPTGNSSVVASGYGTTSGIVVDGAGNLYFASFSGNEVYEIPVGTTAPVNFAAVTNPEGLAVDGAGDVFIAVAATENVEEVAVGGAITQFATGLNHPLGVVLDAAGNMYVSDRNGTTVVKITPANVVSTLASGFSTPLGLAIDAAGDLYVAEAGNNRIDKIAAGTNIVTQAVTGLNSPKYVALDPSGNLYIANAGASTIVEYDRSTASVSFPDTLVTTTSAAVSTSLENDGNLPLQLTVPATATGDFSADASATCTASLAVGASCNLAATFTPTASGPRTGSLTISDNNLNVANASQAASLTGNGTQIALTITASDATMTYGGAAPTITPLVAGLVSPDTVASLGSNLVCTATATSSSAANSAQTSSCSGAVSAKYNISYVSGTVTVNQAPLTITASNGTMTFGGTIPAITPSAATFVNGDTLASLGAGLACTTTATATSNVGSTQTSSCSGAVDNNYNINYVGGTVTITKANSNVTWSPASGTIVYGTSLASVLNATGNGTITYSDGVNAVTGATVEPFGTYTLTATSAGDANHNGSTATFLLNVTKAPLTITASNGTMTFGGTVPTITPAAATFVNGDTLASLGAGLVCTTTATATSNVGSTQTSSCSGAVDNNYNINYVSGTVAVTKASSNVTWSPASGTIVYGTSLASVLNASGTGTVTYANGVTPVTGTTVLPVGTYTLTATSTGDANHDGGTANFGLTVTPAPLTVTASNGTMTFGGTIPTITPAAATFVNSDTLASLGNGLVCTTTATATSNVGSTQTSSCSGAVDNNYNINYVSGTVTITKASSNVTWSPASGTIVYGTSLAAVLNAGGTGTVTYTNGVNAVTGATVLPVGTYTLTATSTGDANHDGGTANFGLTVTPAPLTVTASNGTMTFGGTLPAITASAATFVNNDTLASLGSGLVCTTTATATSNVGSTQTSSCSGAVDNNYNITYATGTVTVTKATSSVSWSPASETITYGTSLSGVLSATGTGTISYTDGHGAVTGATVEPFGTYTLTATSAGDANHDGGTATIQLSVTPAPLTVTASNGTMTFGGTIPTITPAVATFVNGDTLASLGAGLACTTTATATSNVGSAQTSSCSGAVDANYAITYVSGTVTITKATSNVNWSPASGSIVYGTPLATVLNAGGTGTVTYANGVTPVTGTTVLPVGTYTLTATSAGDANHDGSTANFGLTVTPAPLTVTASNGTMTYGGTLPAITPSAATFVNGDTLASLGSGLVCTTTATATSNVGSAQTSSCSGAVDNNYAITYVGGTVTITKATSNVTWSPASGSIVYGTSLSGVLNATGNGTVTYTNGVNPVTGTTVEPVGSYTLTATSSGDANHDGSTANFGLTVTPAPLTVTASNGTMSFGGALPAITASAATFVNGETLASLGSGLVCTTTATATSNVGSTQTSSCSGAVDNNYAISYVGGTVTVTKATSSVSWSPASGSITYGTGLATVLNATGTGTVTYTNGATPVMGTTVEPVGTYTLTATSAGDANHNGGSATFLLTVTKANTTISWNPTVISLPYGSPITAATLDAVGSVPGSIVYSINGVTLLPGTVLPAGNYTITATFVPTDGTDYTGTTQTISFTVAVATQFITFPAIPAQVFGTGNSTVTLNASSSAGLPVTYTVTGPATISGNVLTITGTGTVTVTANAAGSGSIQAATPVSQSFQVTQGLAWGIYATSNVCGAINLNGNVTIDSYDSSLGAYPAGMTKANGNIGTNGNASLSGNVTVYGSLYDPQGNTRGNCSGHSTATTSLTISGNSSVTGGIIPLAAAINFPSPAPPSVTPPVVNQSITGSCGSLHGCSQVGSKHVALAPGTYGDVTISGNTQVDLSAGTYNFDSFRLSGNSVLNIVSGPVIFNLAFKGTGDAMDITGGTLTNNLAPAQFEILYAGTGDIELSGGAQAAAIVYTPNAPVTLSGNGRLAGTIIGATITQSGNFSVDYDRNLAKIGIGGGTGGTQPPPPPQAQTLSFGPLANITYGASAITLAATASSGLPVSYTVTGPASISGSTLTITGAGAVTVTASQAGNSQFEAATPVTQSFNVATAVLTVTANNLSVVYGQVDSDHCGHPENHLNFTYTVTGFVNGDSSGILSGAPSFTTNASASSKPGTYSITISQGTLSANGGYSFQFVSGTLTVTPAVLTVCVNPTSCPTGQVDPDRCGRPQDHVQFSCTVSGYVNGDDQRILSGAPSYSTNANQSSRPGTYQSNASQGTLSANGCYTFQFVGGTFTVTGGRGN